MTTWLLRWLLIILLTVTLVVVFALLTFDITCAYICNPVRGAVW